MHSMHSMHRQQRLRLLRVLSTAPLALVVLLAACDATPGIVGAGAGIVPSPDSTTTATPRTTTLDATATATNSATATRPAATTTPKPTTPPPTSGTGMLPPGSPLPSEATCAARVKRSAWEPRPDNATANKSVPSATQIAALGPWGSNMGLDPKADTLRKQMTGNFTGTTDEILQWVACKWGIDPNIVRAEAVVESYWHQSQRGDYTNNQQYCPPNTWDGSGCYQSYGILQIKWYFFKDAWPMARTDTAFSAEYVYGQLRACYEGWTTYLKDGMPMPGYPSYHAGDIWGCLGRWFSGWWYTQDAVNYIAEVKKAMAQKTWLSSNF
jgi:hypothetical protein